jgi:hypothetical protein
MTVMDQIVQLLAREIPKLSLLTITRSFSDLDVDRSTLLRLRTRIEGILGSTFSDQEWTAVQTPAELLQLVERKMYGPRPH